jgi:EAL domain-containing protein (putative c-di-GMP-specific phosphodiesterase class I)
VAAVQEVRRGRLITPTVGNLLAFLLVVTSVVSFGSPDAVAGPLSATQWLVVALLLGVRWRSAAAGPMRLVWGAMVFAYCSGSATLVVYFISKVGGVSRGTSHSLALVAWALWAVAALAAVIGTARVAQPLSRVPHLARPLVAVFVGLTVDFEVVLWSRFAGVSLADDVLLVGAALVVTTAALMVESRLRPLGRSGDRLIMIGAIGFAWCHAIVALTNGNTSAIGVGWFPGTLVSAFFVSAAFSADSSEVGAPILSKLNRRGTALPLLLTSGAASMVLAVCVYRGWTLNLTIVLAGTSVLQAAALAVIFGRSSPTTFRNISERALRREVRDAVLGGGFVPFFQPILRASDGRVTGYECLARWHHPTRGVLLPSTFLSVAHREGVLDDIDRQMMQVCIDHLDELLPQNVDEPFVSVNVNSDRFRDPAFAPEVIAALAACGRDGTGLVVEISEYPSEKHIELLVQNVKALQDFGVGVAIDDFGAGHSSYQLLLHLDPDIVKLDLSVVAAAEAGSRGLLLTRSAVLAASAVGARVLAEGVSSAQFGRDLADAGVQLLQGFGLGRPQALEGLLKSERL